MRKIFLACGAIFACIVMGACVAHNDADATASGSVDMENYVTQTEASSDSMQNAVRSLDVDPANVIHEIDDETDVLACSTIVESGLVDPANEL